MLVWLWISNIAILFGQQLNSEIERGRELSAGVRGGDPAPAARHAEEGQGGRGRADLAGGAAGDGAGAAGGGHPPEQEQPSSERFEQEGREARK